MSDTGHGAEPRVSDVPEHVGIRELLRLDHHVQRLRAVESILRHREPLHDAEHHERCDALCVGWQLADRPAAVGRLNGRDPFRLELEQIRRRHRVALRLREGDDRIGGGSAIKAIAPVRADPGQRRREVGITKQRAGRRGMCIGEIRGARAGIGRQLGCRLPPHAGIDLAHREALPGVPDRGSENRREREVSKASMQGVPTGHCAWNGHSENPFVGHLAVPARAHKLRRHAGGRPPRRVEAHQATRLGIVDDGEEIAAHAVHHWLDEAERRVGGDRRIDGRPASLEHCTPAIEASG